MNDDDLANALRRSVDLRIRDVSARPNLEDLLARVGRRSARQRRRLMAAVLLVLAVGGFGGYLIGHTNNDSDAPAVAVQSEGLPAPHASSPALEPADVEAARASVAQTFNDAYSGSSPEDARSAAIQDGDKLETLRRAVLAQTQRHGYTTDQFAGASINVLDVTFIDAKHAAVRFTITIPDHGDVLVDRVGYAIFEDGRWKVALRTACDLLSLSGLTSQCPPE